MDYISQWDEEGEGAYKKKSKEREASVNELVLSTTWHLAADGEPAEHAVAPSIHLFTSFP